VNLGRKSSEPTTQTTHTATPRLTWSRSTTTLTPRTCSPLATLTKHYSHVRGAICRTIVNTSAIMFRLQISLIPPLLHVQLHSRPSRIPTNPKMWSFWGGNFVFHLFFKCINYISVVT